MRYAPLCYCTLTLRCPRGDGKSAFEILIHSYPSALPVIPEEKQLRKRRILQRCWCTILKGLAACTNLLQQFDTVQLMVCNAAAWQDVRPRGSLLRHGRSRGYPSRKTPLL